VSADRDQTRPGRPFVGASEVHKSRPISDFLHISDERYHSPRNCLWMTSQISKDLRSFCLFVFQVVSRYIRYSYRQSEAEALAVLVQRFNCIQTPFSNSDKDNAKPLASAESVPRQGSILPVSILLTNPWSRDRVFSESCR